jgi:hypothetical protein
MMNLKQTTLLFFALCFYANAYACRCVAPLSIQEATNRAQYVFSGTVKESSAQNSVGKESFVNVEFKKIIKKPTEANESILNSVINAQKFFRFEGSDGFATCPNRTVSFELETRVLYFVYNENHEMAQIEARNVSIGTCEFSKLVPEK